MKLNLKKRYLGISAVLIVLIVFMLFTGNNQKKLKRAARAMVTVDTTELATYSYDVELTYIGTLYAENEFSVHSKVSGRLVGINYDIGDIIENRAVIARIDDMEFQLSLQQAEGRLAMERSKVQQKQMAIDLAEREFERMKALREEKVISESQLEKAQYDFERQQLTFDSDLASFANQETAVESARLRKSYTNIVAQWSDEADEGTRVLAERFVDVGEIVNTNRPIASIMEIGLLKAEIFVGEKEYPKFKMGMNVSIEVDAFPGSSWEGQVERVAPFLNQQTRQAKVMIAVKNADLRLRPGMFARTTVIFDHRENVVMLPKECIMEWRNVNGIYLYDDEEKQVSFQRVQVGDVHLNNIEILNPQVIDKPVVSVGQHMVRHMMKVNHVKDIEQEPAKKPDQKRPTPQKKPASGQKKPAADGKKLTPEQRAARQAAREKELAAKQEEEGSTPDAGKSTNQAGSGGENNDPERDPESAEVKPVDQDTETTTGKGTDG